MDVKYILYPFQDLALNIGLFFKLGLIGFNLMVQCTFKFVTDIFVAPESCLKIDVFFFFLSSQ